MILVKWGGSLLTNKGTDGPPRFRRAAAARLARELRRGLATARDGALLVHGAGSFGHPQAIRHGIGRRPMLDGAARAVVADVQGRVRDLQGRVVEVLREAGAPALAVPACALAPSSAGGLRFDAGFLARIARAGFLPVTGGDVVRDARLGARILSGDEILFRAVRALRPRRAVWATDVDGVGLGGRLLIELPPRAVRRVVERLPPDRDATGGMRGKLEWAGRLQAAGVESWIVNGARAGRFEAAVAGRRPLGTRLPPA